MFPARGDRLAKLIPDPRPNLDVIEDALDIGRHDPLRRLPDIGRTIRFGA